ncbi:hypothetical protein J6E39_08300 [bacterium]|nr:hypothetical protein [bacterium]
MAKVNGTVPVTVTWKEGGQIQKRTMQVAPGYTFEFGESGKKHTVSANNKNAVLNLTKSEAYILLGASGANKKGDASKYQLDKNDWNNIKAENNSNMVDDLLMHTRTRSGTGAGYIKNADINTRGEYVTIYGQGNEHRISIFYNGK